ncbi:MAG: protein kinase [Calditrichia bacterium]
MKNEFKSEIAGYRILQEIGRGGMGVVYLAEDTRLKRKVAIKFMPETVSGAPADRRQFLNEAQAAAALNHPNIATIHAIEEADDRHFIVMEYIEGKNLQELLEAGPLPLKQAADIALKIADGLKAAHSKGIVHRDIKSANIMVTESGGVKIMDFGVARLPGSTHPAGKDTTAGTTAYMSPEQTQGNAVDHRSDIWSFGVLLYEMLSGKLPFRGEYAQAVIYSILNEEPDHLQNLRPDIPGELAEIINKMLQKEADNRFTTVEEIISALQPVAGKVGFAEKEKASSIAVIPFTDISPARDQDYFCEGIAEEILIALAKIEGLHVVSRTSSFQFREKNRDIREIGRLLNVKAVLEGSVRKAGSRLRINVQLSNVADGFYLWSDRYDRELEDIFAIQEDIAENVAVALRGVLSPQEKQAIRRPEAAIESYECYLKGRHFLNQFAMDESLAMFEKAVEQDPSYGPSYAGLADVHSGLYEWWGARPENLEAAEVNSRKALELAPQLAESHTSRGYVLALGNRYEEAEKEFQAAIDLDANAFDAYYYYARSCFARGEIEKSAELFGKAAEVRREDFQSLSLMGQSLNVMGKTEAADQAIREAARRAERQYLLDPNNRRVLSLGALSLYNSGQREKGRQWLERGLQLYPDDTGVLVNGACLMVRAGRKEKAIDLLEKVFGKGYGKKDWIEQDPDYDPLRNDPRFQALFAKLK